MYVWITFIEPIKLEVMDGRFCHWILLFVQLGLLAPASYAPHREVKVNRTPLSSLNKLVISEDTVCVNTVNPN